MKLGTIVCILGCAAALWADESRIPLSAPATTSTTIVISVPGSYFLARNFASTASPVIEIQTTYVTLDLNGRTITNNGGGDTIHFGTVSNVSIKNGILSGGKRGLVKDAFVFQGSFTFQNVTIQNTLEQGIEMILPLLIDVISCRIVNANTSLVAASAVHLYGGTGQVLDNQILNTPKHALMLQYFSGGILRNNLISSFATAGGSYGGIITTDSNSNLIESNTIVNLVAGTSAAIFQGNSSSHNVFEDNSITGCNEGFNLNSKSNTIRKNSIQGNINGIRLGPNAMNNLIEDNQIQDHSVCGISFEGATANAYRNNMLRGNATAVCNPASNTDAGGNIL